MIERIGDYEVRFELGKGGFGLVYLAFDPRVGRLVAIKVLKAGSDSSLISRFRTEATAAGNLRHKNIVTVYEYGEDQDMQYLVMEYLDGQDLHRLIEGKQPLTLLQKTDIMSQVAQGLHCAHQNNVVHRDVKPANIMVLSDGSVKIMDFGIARLVREGAARLTQSGFMVGTVSYMAPEQFSGSDVDALCDIWAYGVIYYELLTGRHPFPGTDLGAVMYSITSRNPEPIRPACPECPEALERIIMRLLSKDRDARYQTLEDVEFDATPVLRGLQREHAAALLGQAGGLLRTQQLDEAGALARKILELDPTNPEARRLRELIQDRMKQRSTRPRVLTLLKQADTEAAARNYTEAIRIVDSARRLAPQDSSIEAKLEQLMAAKQQAERAARLIEQARSQIDLKDLRGAFGDLTAALGVDPGNAEAQRLLEQVRGEMEAGERQRRLGDELSRAKGLLAMKAFDEASELLDRLAGENPGSAEVQQLVDRLHMQREEDRARRQLQTDIAACQERLKKGEFAEAIARMEELSREFPQESQLRDLLDYARDERRTKDRDRQCERIGREAWGFFKAQDFDRALQILDEGLRTYPGEQKLLGLVQRIASAKTEHEKARRLEREFEQAVAQARGLLDRGQASSATQLLQQMTASYPENPEIRSLLDRAAEAQKEIELNNALALVTERETARAWDDALALVEQAIERHGPAPDLVKAAGRILAQKKTAEIVRNIEQSVARRDWPSARGHLASAKRDYPREHDWAALEEKVQAARVHAEIEESLTAGELDRTRRLLAHARESLGAQPGLAALEAELNQALSRRDALDKARKLLLQGDADRAELAAKDLLKQNPNDAEAAKLLGTVHEQRQRLERGQRIERGRAEVQRLVRQQQFDAALGSLKAMQKEFAGDPGLEEDLRTIEAAKALHAQRLNVNERVAELERDYRKGKAQSVKERALALLAEIEEPRARELLEWAEATLARPPSMELRAVPAVEKKSRTWLWAAVAAVLVAGGVLWKISGGHDGKLSVKPTQMSFVSTSGGALPRPATVTVDGSGPARKWEVSVSDDWISATPQASSVVVAVKPRGLGPGTYSGLLVIATEDGRDRNEVRVKLTVQPAAAPAEPPRTQAKSQPPPVFPPPKQAKRDEPPKAELPKPEPSAPVVAPVVIPAPTPAKPIPPPPPVIDCHAPTYTGLHYGTLRWQNGTLEPAAVLVIGGPDENLSGGRLGGQRLPGCDVDVTPVTAGISIEEYPSRADGFRRVRIRNTSKAAVTLVELQWREK